MATEWIEDLSQSELEYLRTRYTNELKKFKRAYKNGIYAALVISVIFFCMFVLFYYIDPQDENIYTKIPIPEEEKLTIGMIGLYSVYCFIGITFVLSFSFGVGYLFQMFYLKKDIKAGLKIIELTTILEKRYMPHNDSYHFLIASKNRLTIEVDRDVYEFYREGDEINLEYTKNAKIDLGYY